MSDATINIATLFNAYLDDEMTDDQGAELVALLVDSPEHRKRFAQHTFRYRVLHDLFAAAAASEEVSAVATEDRERKTEDKQPTPARSKSWLNRASRHPLVPSIGIAVMIFVALFVGMALTPMGQWIAGGGGDDKKNLKPAAEKKHVAILNNWHNAVWLQGTRPPLNDPRLVVGQRLVLASGVVEITFGKGAVVVLEGPAEFEVVGTEKCALDFGRLVGRCPDEQSKGFTVKTPEADVEDLGTEFAVQVRRGGMAYVEVFEGNVSVADRIVPARFATIELGAKAAAIVDRSESDAGVVIRTITPDGRRFTRAILPETFIDLADIVGGGDGLGTGRRDVGINPRDGQPAIPTVGHVAGENRYNRVAEESNPHGMIDGVFVPHGDGAVVQLTSAGHKFEKFVDASHMTWCNLINGLCFGDDGQLNGVNYYTEPSHSTLGINASMGVTFDLDKIRAHHGDTNLSRFTAFAGVNDRDASEHGDVIFYVFIDGRLAHRTETLSRGDVERLNVEIKSTDRYLTIVTTDGGDDEQYDRAMLGDPRLHVAQKIETSSANDVEPTPPSDGTPQGVENSP